MQSAEDIISSKLETLRKEFVDTKEAYARSERFVHRFGAEPSPEEIEQERENRARRYQLSELEPQIKLLEELKASLDHQHAENKAQFLAIEKRDTVSSKQSFWLTVVSSAVSLVAGWLLSLVGSPSAVLRIFAH